MPSFPLKYNGKYVVWSTVIDAPVSHFVETFEELKRIAPDSTGWLSPAQVENVERDGTPWSESAGSFISGNLAALDEETQAMSRDARRANKYNLASDDLLKAYADDEAGRRRAARNLATVDQALGMVSHQLESLGNDTESA